jgi:hypothetical protein
MHACPIDEVTSNEPHQPVVVVGVVGIRGIADSETDGNTVLWEGSHD